jgi:hypothetical protein
MNSVGRGQAAAPPPTTPRPPAPSSNKEFDDDNTDDLLDPVRDTTFPSDTKKEADEERAAHAVFKRCKVAAATAAEDNDSGISCSSDDPDTPTQEEKAAEQTALVHSFQTLRKAEDVANKKLRLCLLKDPATHRALTATRRRGRDAMTGPGRKGASSLGFYNYFVQFLCSTLYFSNMLKNKKCIAPLEAQPDANECTFKICPRRNVNRRSRSLLTVQCTSPVEDILTHKRTDETMNTHMENVKRRHGSTPGSRRSEARCPSSLFYA